MEHSRVVYCCVCLDKVLSCCPSYQKLGLDERRDLVAAYYQFTPWLKDVCSQPS